MFRRFSANFAVFSIFFDAFLIAASLFIAAITRNELSVLGFVQVINADVWLPLWMYLVFPLIWVTMLLLFSVYDGRKNFRAVDEFGSLTFGSVLAAISMAGVLFLSYRSLSRFLYLVFVLVAYLLLSAWRILIRMIFRKNWFQGVRRDRKVLVLGAGKVGRRLRDQIDEQGVWGLNLVGFLDDDPWKQSRNLNVLGSLDDVRNVVKKYAVDDIVIALPRTAYHRLQQVVDMLYDLPVQVWVVPDYFSLTLNQASTSQFAGIPMVNLRAPALSEYQRMIKRGFDLILTSLSLPIFLPIVLLVSFLIKLDDKGPVFFFQKRMGENGRLFNMIKFRTMVVDAEKLQHLVEKTNEKGETIHKVRNDPRVTKIGRFLRATSLDELPQIFNVLKGDMSLVGPRPEMPHFVEKYDLWQRKRFAVPQGITGWWQVNGRSDRPMHLHTEDDLYYVQNYSIWLDFQILFKTIWVVMARKGAF
jgi:exopolysaccharide biosynthesis polyprenyl glycosylphosphotransferase